MVDLRSCYAVNLQLSDAGGRQRMGNTLVEARLHDADGQSLSLEMRGLAFVCFKHLG
jgi:hypothetical protein